MKNLIPALIIFLFVLGSCGTKSHDHSHGEDGADSANTALLAMVMDIHDEVMPKSDDLYRLKKKLQDSIAATKGMTAEKKAGLEALILSLDSASHAMNEWMHGFKPEKDSANQEKMREYLESEIEKIRQIKERTNEVIAKASGQ